MKKVRRNAGKQIEAILNSVKEVNVYSLENYFRAEKVTVKAENFTLDISKGDADLTDNENGTYKVRYHSNLWYVLDTNKIN